MTGVYVVYALMLAATGAAFWAGRGFRKQAILDACMQASSVGTKIGYDRGYEKGFSEGMIKGGNDYDTGYYAGVVATAKGPITETNNPALAQLNNLAKMIGKSGAVPEMMAVGDKLEIIKTRTNTELSDLKDGGCAGCKYAGRFLFPENYAADV